MIIDTLDEICSEPPLFVKIKSDNGLALIWFNDEYMNSLWEMFECIKLRNDYFKYLEDIFYIEFEKNLNVIYKNYPIVFDNTLSTCIIIEW